MKGASSSISDSSVVGISGKPHYLYGLTLFSGASPAIVTVYSGTDDTGTKILPSITGTANQGKVLELPAHGVHFPGGIYVKVDSGDLTAAIVNWECISKA